MKLHRPHPHPGVRQPDQLTRGERGADLMKRMLATWAALGLVLVLIMAWMVVNSHLGGRSHHFDPYPWILLNLCLSCFAALQCFVLLIANKRGEQIAAEIAVHTQANTEAIKASLDENTTLTSEVQANTACLAAIAKKVGVTDG